MIQTRYRIRFLINSLALKFLFAWRYFKAKKSTNAINIISWVSVRAIILGTASLIVVLSVFNGLEDLVKSLYSSFYTDVRISPASGKIMRVPHEKIASLKNLDGVIGYSLTVEDQALLQYNNLQPVMLKGVDTNYKNINGVSKNISKGEYQTGTADHPTAVLGSGIEYALDIEADRAIVPMTVYLFRNGGINPADPESAVRSEAMASAGSFRIQQDFDDHYVITNLEFMQRMMGLDSNQYGAIEIAVKRWCSRKGIEIQNPGPVRDRIPGADAGRTKPDIFRYNENGEVGHLHDSDPDLNCCCFQYCWRADHAGTGKKERYPGVESHGCRQSVYPSDFFE